MNLDDLLRERRERLQRADRVLPVSDKCLYLMALERFARDPDEIDDASAAHLHECDRCRTLRDAIVRRAAVAARTRRRRRPDGVSVAVSGSRFGRAWKVLVLVGPYVAAACLWVAVLPALRAGKEAPVRAVGESPRQALRDLQDGVSQELKRLDQKVKPLLAVQRGPSDEVSVDEMRDVLRETLHQMAKISARLDELATEYPPATLPAPGR